MRSSRGHAPPFVTGMLFFQPEKEQIQSFYIAAVRRALVEERPLSIAYQAFSDSEPHRRLVEPLRLEERGQSYYLYAYCYRAEADRVFRLDRLHECETDETPCRSA
jgi:proteasome accessory factor C